MYHLTFRPAARRQLEKLADRLTTSDWARIQAAIESLSTEPRPHGVKKLSGKRDFYRIPEWELIESFTRLRSEIRRLLLPKLQGARPQLTAGCVSVLGHK